MKKILIIPSWYPSTSTFSGFFFKEQAYFLNTHGFEVKILMAEELHTKSFIYQYFKRLITNKQQRLSTNFLKQNPEAYSFPLIIQKNWSDKKKIIRFKKAYKKAFKALLKTGWKPDVIHAQNTFRAGIVSQYISKNYSIPYLVIEHSPFKLDSYSIYVQGEIIKALLSAHKVAGVSNYQKHCLIGYGVNRPIDVIWNFVDETIFNIPKTTTSTRFRIVTITYSAPVKDVGTFFKAIAAFVDKHNYTEIDVVVIGGSTFSTASNSSTAYFEEMAAGMGITEICTFIPFADQSEIAHILQSADVLISTSLEETFGIAVREALLCGAAVIATKSGGVEDTLNATTGVLVDVGDFKAIATHLELLKNKHLQFDRVKNRNFVISQSGRAHFLESMTNFYSFTNG